ncbi:MAG: MFS transporter [candidate division Zixibacteria bacterium]|nr:MFS transporter [candidate division Zixibacteria bacterium]
MKSQIKIYYLIQFLTSLAFGSIIPIYVLYFRHYQIDLFRIALLASIFEASILITELPTGYLADLYGRKLSVVLSSLSFFFGGLIFILSPSFSGFILAEILVGLGESFKSGALDAWIVDSLKYHNETDKQKNVFGAGTKYKTAGNLMGLISGGYLGSLNLKLTWVPFTLIFFLSFFFLFFLMPEEYRTETTSIPQKIKPFKQLRKTIRESFSLLKLERIILALIILGLFSEFSYETISQYWQVHFYEGLKINPEYFGWIVAISSVILILSLNLVLKLSSKFKSEADFVLLLQTGFIISLIIIGLSTNPFLAIMLFIALQTFQGFKEPVLLDLYNKSIPSHRRATLLSFINLINSTGEVLAGICIGIIAIRFGLRITFLFGSFVLIAGIILFYKVKRRK